jgi:ribonuclease BN (tRNA processing enzyme)
MECFSFLIKVNEKNIFYSADIGSLDDIKEYLDNLDLLVVEAAHIDINRLGELMKTKSVAKAVLSHIVDENIPMLKQFVETYTGETDLIIAEDNLVIDL